jgi:hypothetical protein
MTLRRSRKCHPEQREGSRHGDQILRVAQDDNILEYPQGAHPIAFVLGAIAGIQ